MAETLITLKPVGRVCDPLTDNIIIYEDDLHEDEEFVLEVNLPTAARITFTILELDDLYKQLGKLLRGRGFPWRCDG
jgi:hypothetical protein